MKHVLQQAKSIGATHYYKLKGGHDNLETVAFWFFRGDEPLSQERVKQLGYDHVRPFKSMFEEVAHYNTTIELFQIYQRCNGLISKDDLIEINV